MSFNVTQQAVEDELEVLEVLFRSLPYGLQNLEYTWGQSTGLILCLSRLKLISAEQKEGYMNELQRLLALGLERREINATRATLDALQAGARD